MARQAVLLLEVGGEAGPLGDRIAEKRRLYERAQAAPDADTAFVGQGGQRPARCMPVDAEASRQVGLVRKPGSWRKHARADLLREKQLDLVPHRHRAVSVDLIRSHAGSGPL